MPKLVSSKARRASRVSVFNHKGGVGKTTLTMNIAAALCDLGRRVLLVDSDPQCNLSSYLIDGEVLDDLLDSADGPKGKTIWSALKPVSEALGGFRDIDAIETGIPNLFLVPGDIRLSEFENDLSDFWAQSVQRKIRGFRGTTALSEFVESAAKKIHADYVFYDSGPNIGPLNRAIVLDCDFLIVPVACDLFSLRALKTLGRTLVSWIQQWQAISALAPEDVFLLKGMPAFLGYIPEGFRVYGDEIARHQSSYLSKIEKEIHSQIVVHLNDLDPKLAHGRLRDFRLGEVRHFGALVPASQEVGLALYDVKAGNESQRNAAREAFMSLAKRIDDRVRAS
jgi:cellulose biosynthesis protein BcsQ